MANKWRRYSYTAQKSYFRRVRMILVWVLLFFAAYTLVTSFCFSVRVLENETMLPGLVPGDRFIFSSYTITHLIRDKVIEAPPPFRRGQVVLVDRAARENRGIIRPLLDRLVRFFTIQQVNLYSREESLFIKRVIALPGDTISMNNFVLRVKPAGDSYEYTEFELSDRDYTPHIPQVPVQWDESLPFSGAMDSITLKEDECFVLSDDRGNTNDSRTWGPIPADTVTGRALVRYWPVTRIGVP
ncbi:signal peptidase I [Spirochaetia bacterium]|nr:signal peptidase I [Spirochaetia bacterium]